VRDVAAVLTERAYGRRPARIYFVGSSEGGREALTMAQRYPADFDGVYARVPVINWTGLQHAGARNGLATAGEGWLSRAQVQLVHDAVLESCDALDGARDGLVANPVGCLASFDPADLRCPPGQSAETCLSERQIEAVRTLRTPFVFPFPLANGVREYPGWSR
jgi:pimeloyl-ACP methyl ester carboxylesterase